MSEQTVVERNAYVETMVDEFPRDKREGVRKSLTEAWERGYRGSRLVSPTDATERAWAMGRRRGLEDGIKAAPKIKQASDPVESSKGEACPICGKRKKCPTCKKPHHRCDCGALSLLGHE